MFNPKTEKISEIANDYVKVVNQLKSLLFGNVHMYIDYANIRPWSDRLKWHIDEKRLKQFLDSFDNIRSVKFYVGTLVGDEESKKFINDLYKYKYDTRTKPVKIMSLSIDATSVLPQSVDLIKQFIRKSLIRKYDVETIEYLNNKFTEMNARGIYSIEDRKCNFDVEIGRDMLVDYERNNIDTYVLWSGDSDFADPISQLLDDGKKVVLFATTRRVASELNELKKRGLVIFDIQKIRNFICWKKEIQSKGDPSKGAPKL